MKSIKQELLNIVGFGEIEVYIFFLDLLKILEPIFMTKLFLFFVFISFLFLIYILFENKIIFFFKNKSESYFFKGKLRVHKRYKRNPKNKLKHMDPIAFEKLLKETTILAEEEFDPLKTERFYSFFNPRNDKAYYIFMFNLTVTESLVFFKQKISPSLTIYKGNIHSLKSIILRFTGICFYFLFVIYFLISQYDIGNLKKLINTTLRFLYDEQAMANFYMIHGFAFNFFIICFICFHVIYGYMHYFSISKKLTFAAIFKSILIIIFSIFFFNFIIYIYFTNFPKGGSFIINSNVYGFSNFLCEQIMNIFWKILNVFNIQKFDVVSLISEDKKSLNDNLNSFYDKLLKFKKIGFIPFSEIPNQESIKSNIFNSNIIKENTVSWTEKKNLC